MTYWAQKILPSVQSTPCPSLHTTVILADNVSVRAAAILNGDDCGLQRQCTMVMQEHVGEALLKGFL